VENKGPVLISYLSQIILIIVLLQVSGTLKGLTIIVMLITEALIITSLIKERKWDFQRWYAFFIFIIILLFLVAHIQPGTSEITAPLSVEIIVSLILGFFLTVFSKEAVEEEPSVKVVEMEPTIEPITEKPKKSTAKKELLVSVEGSKKYHRPTCVYVSKVPKSKITVYTSKRQAAGKGLSACKNCIK